MIPEGDHTVIFACMGDYTPYYGDGRIGGTLEFLLERVDQPRIMSITVRIGGYSCESIEYINDVYGATARICYQSRAPLLAAAMGAEVFRRVVIKALYLN